MRELIDEVEFEHDEKALFFRQPGDRFLVKLSVGKKFFREKIFDRKDNAEDFFDSFMEGNDIRKHINKMLEEVSSDYTVNYLPYL